MDVAANAAEWNRGPQHLRLGIGLRFAWGIASHAVANVLRRSLEGHAPKLDANQRDTGRWRSVDATVLTLDLQENDGAALRKLTSPDRQPPIYAA